MTQFAQLDQASMGQIKQKLEALTKSFSAGYQGLSNAGRTGISALAKDHIDPVLKSITLEDKDFLLTKDIPTLAAKHSVYQYKLKTAVRDGSDLAGFEAFLPQDSSAQYMVVAEILKIYGIRKHITEMAELINDVGGYDVDLEKENDQNAAMAMAEQMERDLYVGGDHFINSQGEIDSLIASNPNMQTRHIRGIQANVREGDKSKRGIPGDFVGYGNNRSVVFDNKGGVIDRKKLDEVVTAVADSRGAIAEGHCTTSQIAEFRATFFPIERADINTSYSINGPAVSNDEHVGFNIPTCKGNMKFIPTVFKYNILVPQAQVGSSGQMPATPVIATTAAGSSVLGKGSGFVEGQDYRYRVQACNISGKSHGSASVLHSVGAGEDNKPIEVTWSTVAQAEYYMVFRTPVESSGKAGTEFYIGKVYPQASSTVFVDNNRLIPGLDGILFMPKDKNRAKLAVLGNLLNKTELGIQGLAKEWVYSSYFACVVERPRSFAVLDNVFQKREGL